MSRQYFGKRLAPRINPALLSLPAIAIVLFALPGKAMAQSTLTCASEDGKRHYCNADTRSGVRMLKQRSGSPCIQGSTWGYDRSGVWVDRGCRADFELRADTGRGSGRGYDDRDRGRGRDWGRNPRNDNWRDRDPNRNSDNRSGSERIVTCSSEDGGRHYCNADISRGVTLGKQRSGSPCRQGSTWGYDRRGIWVDKGCRADFIVR